MHPRSRFARVGLRRIRCDGRNADAGVLATLASKTTISASDIAPTFSAIAFKKNGANACRSAANVHIAGRSGNSYRRTGADLFSPKIVWSMSRGDLRVPQSGVRC